MSKKKTDALATNVDMKEVGRDLVKNAIQMRKEGLNKNLVHQVQSVVEAIAQAELVKRGIDAKIAVYTRQLEAIKAGEITVDNYSGAMFYNEKELNNYK